MEEVAEVLGADGIGVLLKGDPGWAGGQRGDAVGHFDLSCGRGPGTRNAACGAELAGDIRALSREVRTGGGERGIWGGAALRKRLRGFGGEK